MSIIRFAVILTAAIFFGEIAVMYALEFVPIQNALLENVLDASALVCLVFPVLYFFSLRSIILSNKVLEEKIYERTSGIQRAKGALEASVNNLKRHHRDVLLLSEMGKFFQSCRNLDEAMTVAEVKLAHLFSEVSGSLFLLNNSRNILELAATWGHRKVGTGTLLRMGAGLFDVASPTLSTCRKRRLHANTWIGIVCGTPAFPSSHKESHWERSAYPARMPKVG
jgi:hypothetical protein